MPMLVILLSVLGLVPFVACGLAALGPDQATAAPMLQALIDYAALILAFAGGIHWGLELQSPQQDVSLARARVAIAAAAPVAAWIALLLSLLVAPWVSLIVLVAAYVAALLVEQEGARRGLVASQYLWLRWGFTIVAVAMLTTGPDAAAAWSDHQAVRIVWILRRDRG